MKLNSNDMFKHSCIVLSTLIALCRLEFVLRGGLPMPMRPVLPVIIGANERKRREKKNAFMSNVITKCINFNKKCTQRPPMTSWFSAATRRRHVLVRISRNPFRYQNRWKFTRASISQLTLIKFIAFKLKGGGEKNKFCDTFNVMRCLSPPTSTSCDWLSRDMWEMERKICFVGLSNQITLHHRHRLISFTIWFGVCVVCIRPLGALATHSISRRTAKLN